MGNPRHPKTQKPSVLLVDDDPLIVDSIGFALRRHFEVRAACSREEAMEIMRATKQPMLGLIDLGLPPEPHEPRQGFMLIASLLSHAPDMKILVLSGQNQQGNIQHALTLGAADFIEKPCDVNLLIARLHHHFMMLEAEQSNRDRIPTQQTLLGESTAIGKLRDNIRRYAETPFPVLVEGESGTGKELVAVALHDQGTDPRKPFLTVNCAAFTPDLLESQLFGHARGAFTGAVSTETGFFEDAGDGTLFLDEIGEFPLSLQPKLLRVLENGEYYRIGETRSRKAAARIIAATNRDLQAQIRDGHFRQDLYHRLSVLTIQVPPLRERAGDAEILIRHFQTMYATKVAPFTLTEHALERWRRYAFPGNVRELRNIVIRLGAKYPGENVGLTELEPELDTESETNAETVKALSDGEFKLDDILSAWEQRYIDAAMDLSKGNLSEAARLLGVNRTTLYSKIQRLRDIQH